MDNNQYTVTLEEDAEGNLILPLPEDVFDKMGIVEGDYLIFEPGVGESFSIRKATDEEVAAEEGNILSVEPYRAGPT